MRIAVKISEVTDRTTHVAMQADSFADERILKELVDALKFKGGEIVAKSEHSETSYTSLGIIDGERPP